MHTKTIIREWRYWIGLILSIISNLFMLVGIAIASYMSKSIEIKYIGAYTLAIILFSSISNIAFDIMDEARARAKHEKFNTFQHRKGVGERPTDVEICKTFDNE